MGRTGLDGNKRRENIFMKMKRIVVALVCAASVLASVVPVSAKERAGHVCVWGSEQTEATSGYWYANDTYHKQSYRVVKYCQDYPTCGKVNVIRTGENQGTHSWSDAYDQGHRGEDEHAFKLKCGTCGGGPEIRIICNYNTTGRHNTPW